MMTFKQSCVFGIVCLVSGASVNAATCSTSNLAGKWEAVLTEANDTGAGTFYCSGMRIRNNGSVDAAGKCTGNATEIKNGKAVTTRISANITGGKFKLTARCRLDVSGGDRSYLKLGGGDTMRFNRGVYNKTAKTMITSELAGDGTYNMIWTKY